MRAPDNTKDHYAPVLGVNLEAAVGTMPFWLGSMLKYLFRAPRKGKYADMNKALDCAKRGAIVVERLGTSTDELPQRFRDFYLSLRAALKKYEGDKYSAHLTGLQFAYEYLTWWILASYNDGTIDKSIFETQLNDATRRFAATVKLLPEEVRRGEVIDSKTDLWKDLRD
jgi:hypothetical protein